MVLEGLPELPLQRSRRRVDVACAQVLPEGRLLPRRTATVDFVEVVRKVLVNARDVLRIAELLSLGELALERCLDRRHVRAGVPTVIRACRRRLPSVRVTALR